MGYESEFYVVKKYPFDSSINGYKASDTIARFDACKMGYDTMINEFLACFDTETDFAIKTLDYDEELEAEINMDVIEDKYGSHLKYCSDLNKALEILKQIKKESDYERFKWLYKFLKAFKDAEDVYIVHYGY